MKRTFKFLCFIIPLALVFASTNVTAQPANFTDLGNIGMAGSYTFSTCGFNAWDTEIGLYDDMGNVIAAVDDYCGLQSEVSAPLADGCYYIGISEFNSQFDANYVNSGTAFEDGDLETAILAINGVQAGMQDIGEDVSNPALEETAWFKVTVGEEPEVSIPTLSEWGLISLALLLMAFGTVKMAAGSVSFAGAGNSSLPIPGTNNFRLPFNAAIFRKAMLITGVLALIGFAICFAIYGAIFMPDIIGVAIAGPIFAYLMHLLYVVETNRSK